MVLTPRLIREALEEHVRPVRRPAHRSGQQRQFPIVTWTDEAIRMFTDHALGPLTTREVHALIDWIDERPDLAAKLDTLDRESLREELRVLAQPLLEARRAAPSPSCTSINRT